MSEPIPNPADQAEEEELTPEDKAAIAAYRQSLIEAEKKGQESFDKTVLSLAGGALGISFIFVKDIIGPNPIVHPLFLLSAWLCWALSTLAVLSSFFTSNQALRHAVKQCDSGKIYCEAPGGFFSRLTRMFNICGIAFLIVGIVFMAAFVYCNLLDREKVNDPKASSAAAPYTDAKADTNTAANSARRP